MTRALLMLGAGGLAFLGGVTSQNCTNATGSKAVAIAGVGAFTCALMDDATIKCWGYNGYGQLGLGDASSRGDDPNELGTNLPSVDLGAGKTPGAVITGYQHACAILDDATVKCWGGNDEGQLGLGDLSNRGDDSNEMGTNLPSVDLGAGRKVKALSAGMRHTCALLDDATIKCWGYNGYGQLGLGDASNRGDDPYEMGTNLTSVDLGPGRTAVAVVAGSWHTCALLEDASIKCWGLNEMGQLGLRGVVVYGDVEDRGDNPYEMGTNLSSIDLGLGRTAKAITAGGGHTCALMDDASVKCWGMNIGGQLGIGDTLDRGYQLYGMGKNLSSVDLGVGRTALVVEAGGYHTCALLDDATVKCWGYNEEGQLGTGDASHRGDNLYEMGENLTSIDLGAGRTPVAIVASWFYTCALLDDETIKCWGYNVHGQLGRGDVTSWGLHRNEMGEHLPALAFCGCSPGAQIIAVSAEGNTSTTSMRVCACEAGFTGDAASAASCVACEAGTYKSGVGSAVCTSCPVNAVTVEGGMSCACAAGFTGDASGGESCTACRAGAHKSVTGSAVCSACPVGTYVATQGSAECSKCPSGSSVSVTGSVAVTACICSVGYAGSDGGPCTGCGPGTYSNATGSAVCAVCPADSFASTASNKACTRCGANAASAKGSTAASSCGCAPGFWGDAASGEICTACPVGSYKNSVGATECSSCPEEDPQSFPGSTTVGDCGASVSFITFSGRLQMSQADFESPATSAAYVSGVAAALDVAETSVLILSVVEQTTGRRRKLLVTSVVVETRVVVSAEQAVTVARRITTANLNSALSFAGISVEEVFNISTVSGPASLSAGGLAGIAIGGVALLAACVCVCWGVVRTRRAKLTTDNFARRSQLLGLAGNVAEAAKGADAQELRDLVEDSVKNLGKGFRLSTKGKFAPLVFGNFDEATTALSDFLCVNSAELHANMAKRELAVVSEIEEMVAGVRQRVIQNSVESKGWASDEDQAQLKEAEELEECLDYVLNQEAGSSKVVFENGGATQGLKRDCDTDGNLLPSREIVDRETGQTRGMLLDDFTAHPSSKLAGLGREHVLALRLYTTVAFKSINHPLRDATRKAEGKAHPLPVTVALLEKAVLQLRKVEGNETTAHDSVDLYRGLASRSIPEEFLAKGGTELASMSTTRDLKVALQYCASEHAVILRLRTEGFMGRGADIAFLSAFPAESEVVFPPLTYLGPVREKDENGVEQPKKPQVMQVGGASLSVLDVQPQK